MLTMMMLRAGWGGVGSFFPLALANDLVLCGCWGATGDNEAEAIVSAINQNSLGRSAPKQMHAETLACKYHTRLPGLDAVLEALSLYRPTRADKLGCNPKHFLDLVSDRDWPRQ